VDTVVFRFDVLTTFMVPVCSRFSRDLDDVDVRLPLILDMFLQQVWFLLWFWSTEISGLNIRLFEAFRLKICRPEYMCFSR